MNHPWPGRLLLVVFAAAGPAACSQATRPEVEDGGTTSGADAGGAKDAARLADRGMDSSTGSKPADGGAPDTRRERPGTALPPGSAPAKLMVPGNAQLVGSGNSSCSNQLPASGNGDRWCAYSVAGAAGATELWVINVTKAAARTPPKCDGTDANCLKLTANLWTGTPLDGDSHPGIHRFEGDTLIFHADAMSGPGEFYRGPIQVWRPGWAKPRQISSPQGVYCQGHEHHPVVYCLDNLAFAGGAPVDFDLRAGAVTEQAGGLLPKIERARALRKDGDRGWQAEFSHDGTQFAFSTVTAASDLATVRVVPTSGLGATAPKQILQNVRSWTLAGDGRKIYHLSSFANGAGGRLHP